MLYSVLVSVDVLIAAGLIGLVLMQQGKGASAGAAFGGGSSGTVFGARGSASFLTRTTAILAALFFINSIVLAYLAANRPVESSVVETTVQEQSGVADSATIDEIKQEIEAQMEKAAENESTSLPADVPGLESGASSLEEGVEQAQDQIRETAQDVIEESKEAVQSLPADVPQ